MAKATITGSLSAAADQVMVPRSMLNEAQRVLTKITHLVTDGGTGTTQSRSRSTSARASGTKASGDTQTRTTAQRAAASKGGRATAAKRRSAAKA